MSQTNRRRAPTRSVVSPRRVLFGLLRGMALASVACLLLAAGWWLNQALAVQSWQVHGVPEALETAIDKQLNDMQPLDLAHAWPSLLRSRLLDSLPDLAEVNISRHLPDRLEISASMRMPVALWSDTSGTVQLVDGHGLAYRPLKPGEGLDLPVLRVPADEVKQSVALMLRLKQMDDARYATLSEWIAERYAEVPSDMPVVVHCKLGGRSAQAVEFLRSRGYDNVMNLSGGIIRWIDDIDGSLTKY